MEDRKLVPMNERKNTEVSLTPREDFALRAFVTAGVSLGIHALLTEEVYEDFRSAINKFNEAEAVNEA